MAFKACLTWRQCLELGRERTVCFIVREGILQPLTLTKMITADRRALKVSRSNADPAFLEGR